MFWPKCRTVLSCSGPSVVQYFHVLAQVSYSSFMFWPQCRTVETFMVCAHRRATHGVRFSRFLRKLSLPGGTNSPTKLFLFLSFFLSSASVLIKRTALTCQVCKTHRAEKQPVMGQLQLRTTRVVSNLHGCQTSAKSTAVFLGEPIMSHMTIQ